MVRAVEITGRHPICLVSSLNPYRIEGQKTAAFEICDALGAAPDWLCLPVGNAGNITACWAGFEQYHRLQGAGLPRVLGAQAAGLRARVFELATSYEGVAANIVYGRTFRHVRGSPRPEGVFPVQYLCDPARTTLKEGAFMNERVAIVGVGWSGFRPTTPEVSYKELMYEAAVRAYDDAGVDPRAEVQSFVTVAEDFIEGTSIFDEYVPDQIGAALKSVHTIPGDGLHGLASAWMLVRTGAFDVVAVEAHSKASNVLTLPEITAHAQDPVLNRPLRLNTHFVAGMEMQRYLFESDNTREACAAVTVKNRANALKNPLASYGADLTLEDVLLGPSLAWPLGVRETAGHADGAIVMVLASERVARNLSDSPVWILGMGWCNDSPSLESREWGNLPYLEAAAHMAYRQAGIADLLDAVDFAEVDDTYAYKELQSLEALGVFRPGEAGPATLDGFTSLGASLPVNASGGSLGVGGMLDATGLQRALEAVLQLRGQAGAHQVEGAGVGLVQSWRGVPTTSGVVAILSN